MSYIHDIMNVIKVCRHELGRTIDWDSYWSIPDAVVDIVIAVADFYRKSNPRLYLLPHRFLSPVLFFLRCRKCAIAFTLSKFLLSRICSSVSWLESDVSVISCNRIDYLLCNFVVTGIWAILHFVSHLLLPIPLLITIASNSICIGTCIKQNITTRLHLRIHITRITLRHVHNRNS